MAQLHFNAASVVPDTGRGDPLPAGWYNVMMEKSEMKPTKDGTGSYLACTFGVVDGQFKGRKLFHNLNLQNANQQAMEIAYKQLSAICHAVGYLMIQQDSSELHGKPLKVKVKLTAATEQYEAGNDISAFRNINDPTAGAPAGAAAPMMGAPVAPPQQAPQGWTPPVQQQAPVAGYAPAPAGWQPPAQAPAPQQQQYQPPAQPPQQPQGMPAWQPPAGAAQQPWAAPAQAPAPQAPVQPPAQAPAGMQPAWQPPAQQAPAGAVPPWMQQPPAAQ